MALVVEDKKLYVASNVLSLMSPVFTAMFEEQFKEDGPKEIELHGKKFDEVAEFLRCLYPNTLKSITQENVFAVLPLADEFKIDRLKLECENVLLKEINVRASPENIYKCLQQAYIHKLNNLRIKAVDIATNLDQQKSGVVEGKLQLPLELQTEIQKKQIENLNKTVSKLKLENVTMEEECKNLKDCVKHFWPDDLKKADHEQFEVGVLVLPLPDVRSITELGKNAKKCINGITWSVRARRQKNEIGGDSLSVYLTASAPKHWKNWSCEVHDTYLLISNSKDNDFVGNAKCQKSIFSHDAISWGYDDFIKMQQLSDDKYVQDGSALMKAFLMVKHPWCKPVF